MRLFLHQFRADQLLFWRSREAAVFVFLFPVMLFVLLGAVYSGDFEGRPVAEYLVAGLLGYGVANTTLGGLAILLVTRRELGLLKRVRATPLPAPTFLAATLASTLVTFAIQAAAIVALGSLVYGADLPEAPLSLAAVLAAGALAFAAMGFGLASVVRSAEGVSPVVNVIVLPMTFLSGGFGPRQELPQALQTISDVLPLRYFIDAVVATALEGEPLWEQGTRLAIVALWGVAGLLVAARRFRWQPREG
ncbi:MAG TPA: ABC transporter permease [Gaiellaceae bacterium]|nr:ABC transporter permease [Gaiellaceae bacterium]